MIWPVASRIPHPVNHPALCPADASPLSMLARLEELDGIMALVTERATADVLVAVGMARFDVAVGAPL